MKSKDDLKHAFKAMDKDGDGHLTLDELRLFMWGTGQRATEKELADAFDGCDKDGDGKVGYQFSPI